MQKILLEGRMISEGQEQVVHAVHPSKPSKRIPMCPVKPVNVLPVKPLNLLPQPRESSTLPRAMHPSTSTNVPGNPPVLQQPDASLINRSHPNAFLSMLCEQAAQQSDSSWHINRLCGDLCRQILVNTAGLRLNIQGNFLSV